MGMIEPEIRPRWLEVWGSREDVRKVRPLALMESVDDGLAIAWMEFFIQFGGLPPSAVVMSWDIWELAMRTRPELLPGGRYRGIKVVVLNDLKPHMKLFFVSINPNVSGVELLWSRGAE